MCNQRENLRSGMRTFRVEHQHSKMEAAAKGEDHARRHPKIFGEPAGFGVRGTLVVRDPCLPSDQARDESLGQGSTGNPKHYCRPCQRRGEESGHGLRVQDVSLMSTESCTRQRIHPTRTRDSTWGKLPQTVVSRHWFTISPCTSGLQDDRTRV